MLMASSRSLEELSQWCPGVRLHNFSFVGGVDPVALASHDSAGNNWVRIEELNRISNVALELSPPTVKNLC